jgi:hypothetical protein
VFSGLALILLELPMRSSPGRTSVAETATAVCLLVFLVIVAGAVIGTGLRESLPDGSVSAPEAADPQSSSESSIAAPPGFRAASKAETYNPETLYEKINGKADMYLEAGFRSLLCQRFVSEKDGSLWLEVFVYDMATPVNAFGVYGQQKRSDVTDLDITPFAYKTVDGVYLAAGAAYIEMHGSVATDELSAAMLAVARSLAGTAGTDSGLTAAIAIFPKAGHVAGSSALYPVDAFGCSLLNNVYTMQYDIGGKHVMVFISPRESIEAAAKLALDYAKFIVDNGGKEIAVKGAFTGKAFDFYETTEIVFARGSIVAGVHGAEDAAAAMTQAQKLWDSLPDEATPFSAIPAAQPASGEYSEEY